MTGRFVGLWFVADELPQLVDAGHVHQLACLFGAQTLDEQVDGLVYLSQAGQATQLGARGLGAQLPQHV
jgi:hypothetical protein